MWLAIAAAAGAAPLVIHVVDADARVLVGADVVLDDSAGVTDGEGTVVLEAASRAPQLSVSRAGASASWTVVLPDDWPHQVWVTLAPDGGDRAYSLDVPLVRLAPALPRSPPGTACHASSECVGPFEVCAPPDWVRQGDRSYAEPPPPPVAFHDRCGRRRDPACPAAEVCDAAGWCAPRRCPDTLTCAAGQVCAPDGRCAGAACTDDAACAPGSCLDGVCASGPGTCVFPW